MTEEVKTIKPDATIKTALQKMLKNEISSLIVGNDKLKGIITLKDIAHAVIDYDDISSVKVDQLMTTKLVTIGHRAYLNKAMELMHKHEISHLPVMKGDKMVGMLSTADFRTPIVWKRTL